MVCLFVLLLMLTQLRLQQYASTAVHVNSNYALPSLSRVAQITYSLPAVAPPTHKDYLPFIVPPPPNNRSRNYGVHRTSHTRSRHARRVRRVRRWTGTACPACTRSLVAAAAPLPSLLLLLRCLPRRQRCPLGAYSLASACSFL